VSIIGWLDSLRDTLPGSFAGHTIDELLTAAVVDPRR
jgi:hypothetical protein